jgi:hypothetical protein
MGKFPAHLRVILKETNSAETISRVRMESNAKFTQRRNRLGHQAFAASLVNRRLNPVGYGNGHSSLPRGDRCREPCRPAPDHKHIHI